MLRWCVRLGLIAVIAVAVALTCVGIVLEDQPAVSGKWAARTDDVARARAVLRQHDPRTAKPGEIRTLALSERDLNLVANYAMNLVSRGAAEGEMRPDVLDLVLTFALPDTPLGRYLNATITVRTPPAATRLAGGETDSVPPEADAEHRPLWFTRVCLGALDVPPVLAEALIDVVLGELLTFAKPRQGATELGETTSWRYWLAGAAIEQDSMTLIYRTPQVALERLRSILVEPAVRDAMAFYQGALARRNEGRSAAGSLVADVLPALFREADARSAAGANPVAENRALLIVLAAHSSGRGLERLAPEAAAWPSAGPMSLTLHRRRDYAQHFLASAALAAVAGSALADLVGLYKEVDDATAGSGFSFTDYMADRAGTRFGEAAVASTDSARRFQRTVSRLQRDLDVLPAMAGLPEGLTAAQFDRRYGPVGSPAYRAVVQEIDGRIDALALYQVRP